MTDKLDDGPYAALLDALKARRKELGLAQALLDEKIGCANGQVGKWEARIRRANLVSLVTWAQALGCRLIIQSLNAPKVFNSAIPILSAIEDAGATVELTLCSDLAAQMDRKAAIDMLERAVLALRGGQFDVEDGNESCPIGTAPWSSDE